MSLQVKSAKYVVWKGEQKNYEFWKPKFMLNCKLKGAIKGFKQSKIDIPKEGITPDEIESYRKEREIYESNNTK